MYKAHESQCVYRTAACTRTRAGRLVLRTWNGDPNSRGQPLRRGWLTSAFCVSQVCLFWQSPTRHQQTTKINRNRQSVSAASAPVQERQYEKTNSPFCAPTMSPPTTNNDGRRDSLTMEEIFSHPLVWPYTFSSNLKPLRNKHGPCAGCGKFPDPGKKFRTCAACKAALYCSKECQKSNRNMHRYVVIHRHSRTG